MPEKAVTERCRRYMRNGEPTQLSERINDTDFSIITQYQLEYREFVQYNTLATNIGQAHRLNWIMQVSLLKTLANKHKSTTTKLAKQYVKTIITANGPKRVLQAK
ncbi:hypothetical protein GXN76_12460 [Kroppenstedtia pulmonis]|uniref:Domain X domain-containing protein n=2 Tax=Kroppenstedtia pulmonis TaxID=1380685 RepID=A0A7D3Y5V9_9BACL|nr:hypothetical protein GXN76_12460 [Kroppenstedtia pulmonis]